jgi:hypothetical protein
LNGQIVPTFGAVSTELWHPEIPFSIVELLPAAALFLAALVRSKRQTARSQVYNTLIQSACVVLILMQVSSTMIGFHIF